MRAFPIFTALTLAVSLPAFAQLGNVLKKKGSPAATEAKNVMRYEKLKEYSLAKYQNDVDFKDDVDDAFELLLREHSARAYMKNTGVQSFIMSVREDNWRVHHELYDNLVVQDQVNRVGQRLVPPNSERLFAFKVVPDPTPLAETLSTGTIYVSTGLISLLESEAQLAYVLAHEMAHVQLDHWKERVILERGQEAYAADQAQKTARLALLGSIAGAGVGAVAGRGVGAAAAGAATGAGVGLLVGSLLYRPLIVAWDKVEEDMADDLAFKSALAANYDVREVPNLYLAMQNATTRDTRVALGFLGNRRRVSQRLERVNYLIGNQYKAEIAAHLKTGFSPTSPEHLNLMAELKRDNGIMAYYSDMFELARANLNASLAIRENDPAAHYFYGKVLKLVGRTDEDAKLAQDEFVRAQKIDYQQQNYGSHLHLALMLARDKNADKQQIVRELDSYVTNYARWRIEHGALQNFPPNLDSIYQYMTLFGDPNWRPKPPDEREFLANYEMMNNPSAGGPANPPQPEAAPAPPPRPQPTPPPTIPTQKKTSPPRKK